MQKQQRNAEAVLLKECLGGQTTVSIKRYRVLNDIVFMDGFLLPADSEVRGVIDSEEKNECINVVYELDNDVKRIVWIEKNKMELVSVIDEQWQNDKYKSEITDKNENWFD